MGHGSPEIANHQVSGANAVHSRDNINEHIRSRLPLILLAEETKLVTCSAQVITSLRPDGTTDPALFVEPAE